MCKVLPPFLHYHPFIFPSSASTTTLINKYNKCFFTVFFQPNFWKGFNYSSFPAAVQLNPQSFNGEGGETG